MYTLNRRKSIQVQVGNVTIGGDSPVVVQSMTNTDTADIDATGSQQPLYPIFLRNWIKRMLMCL
jgi:hypothetical protein